MASSQISAQTRVQVLIEYVNEKELDCGEVAELKRLRLQQIIQLLQLQNEASQVIRIHCILYLPMPSIHSEAFLVNATNFLDFTP